MKRILFLLSGFLMFYSQSKINAQSFTTVADTVWGTITTSGPVFNNVTNKTGSNITMKWHVVNTDFPADWLTSSAFGICDAMTCVNNISGILWNGTTGTTQTCMYYYSNAAHDSTSPFNLSMNLSSATSTGTHWVTVNLLDIGSSYTKNVTFILTKPVPSAVAAITNVQDKVALYPNPANNELNVVYDENAEVKNIAVYNVIGKMMNVYKVTGNSANLNIENIPSGIYFVRLYNGNGNVVVTRKFTKQ